jgi:hypothetical protein
MGDIAGDSLNAKLRNLDPSSPLKKQARHTNHMEAGKVP